MTERIITVPIDHVRVHPDNPRLAAAADEELVDSIRVHGLIDPPLCAPETGAGDGDWVVLLDGHRRFDGAQRAGLSEITVRVRDDLVTAAQQIEVMAITGLQKELLSPVEEARAYEQLQLLGMDEAAIAKSTGYTKARVKQRLKLTGLTDGAKTAVHTGQATLGDVEAFHEFADDPTAVAELEEAIGTSDFRMKVAQLRSRRERIERHDRLVAEFEELGATAVGNAIDCWNLHAWEWRGTDLESPEGHDGCLAYVDYGADSYTDPRLVCSDPKKHRDARPEDPEAAAAVAKQRAEFEAEQAARAAAAEEQKAAAIARRDWLIEHFTGLFPVKGNARLAETLAGFLPAALADTRLSDMLDWLDASGAAQPEVRTFEAEREAVSAVALELTSAKPARVLAAFGRYLAVWASELLAETYVDDEDLPFVLGLWDWLAASGYPMSSIDVARHQALAARAADDEESDDEGDAA